MTSSGRAGMPVIDGRASFGDAVGPSAEGACHPMCDLMADSRLKAVSQTPDKEVLTVPSIDWSAP